MHVTVHDQLVAILEHTLIRRHIPLSRPIVLKSPQTATSPTQQFPIDSYSISELFEDDTDKLETIII